MGQPVKTGAISASPTPVFTAPTPYTTSNRLLWKLSALTINNDSGSAATIDIHIVASGGSVADTNKIVNTMILPDNSSASLQIGEQHYFLAGDTLQIVSNVTHASLVYRASFKQENTYLE